MKTHNFPSSDPLNSQTRKRSHFFSGTNTFAWALAIGLICLAAPQSLHAASGIWTGGGSDGLWNNTLNWSGGTVANGNASATFNATVSNNSATLESGHSLKFIFFDTSTGSYTIGGSSLTLFTGGNVTLQSTATGTNLVETINAPISFSTGVYTFTNNRADAGSRLVFGGTISNSGASTLTVNGSGTGSNEISGSINDGGGTQGVTKSGSTTWTLSGTNTYTGATTVSVGTLLVNGTHSGGSANGYTVGATGVLGGTGAITTATVTTATGSKLTPGGTGIAEDLSFTLASGASAMDISLSSNDSGAYLFDLAAPSASDKIVLTLGALNIGSMTNADFVFTELTGFSNGTYVLFDASSGITGSVTSALNSINFTGGRTGTLSLDAINNNVLLTVVPEPATCALLAFSLTTVMVLRRRRSRKF